MSKGINVKGNSHQRGIYLEDALKAKGGIGEEGVHCTEDGIIFDGKSISSAKGNVGMYLDNSNRVRYNDDVLVHYNNGITNIFQIYKTATYNYPSGWIVSSGAKQGAAIYKNKWYQFFAGGHVSVYDILGHKELSGFDIPNIWPDSEAYHISSAQFSDEFENDGDELPLVYLSTNGYVCVVNLNGTPHLVRWFFVEHNPNGDTTDTKPHPAFCVFDFAHNIGYAFGYPKGVKTNKSAHVSSGKFEVIKFTFVKEGTGVITSNIDIDYTTRRTIFKEQATYLNEPDYPEYDSDWSNLQSGDFADGVCYVLFGGSDGGTNKPKILIYNPTDGTYSIVYTNIYKHANVEQGVEGEGIARYKNGFIISTLYQGEKMFVSDLI